MMSDITLITGTIFGILDDIFDLYTGCWILTGFLMLWLFRRIARLFDRL